MSNEIIQAFEEEFLPMKAEIDKQWFGTFKAGYDACLAQKPNYRYFIREIGEGGWQEVTYSRYAESLGCPHTDYKREQTDSQAALASQAKQTESKPSIEDVQNLVDASESIMKWLVENVHRWNFKTYDRLHLATMRVKDSIPPAPEGDKP